MKKFEVLYEENYPVVYMFLFSLTGNHELSEDLTQETFLKAMKGIRQYKGNCKITTWLIQIAKNNYFTYYRRHRKKDENSILEQFDEKLCRGLEEQIIEKEHVSRIRAIIQGLEEPYKEVTILHLYGELSFLEISKVYEKSESWARVVFYRAKKKIKVMLEEEEHE